MAKVVQTVEGQTLHDLCIQHYGSYDGLEELVELNQGVVTSLDVMLKPGTVLNIGEPIEEDVVDYYIRENINVVSGLFANSGNVDNGVFGIEFSNVFA